LEEAVFACARCLLSVPTRVHDRWATRPRDGGSAARWGVITVLGFKRVFVIGHHGVYLLTVVSRTFISLCQLWTEEKYFHLWLLLIHRSIR
jgi:hypothetical protein